MLEGRSNGDSEALARYARAARAYPPLSRAQEHAVALRARQGDALAEQTLVRHNLLLVMVVVRRLRRGALGLDDLIQEGNLGLLRAAAKFDPHAGTRFSTYAVWWIRAFVGRHLRAARSTVRPRTGTVAQTDFSLDLPSGDDEQPTHLELLVDEAEGAESRFLAAERDRDVRQALPRLRKRLGELGWTILHERLLQDAPRTLAEVGLSQGVSRERVRQVEARTRRYLSRALAPVDPGADGAGPDRLGGLTAAEGPRRAAGGWR
jgi:RNA polymerase primary sigma factor